jgi:hypothetical protein
VGSLSERSERRQIRRLVGVIEGKHVLGPGEIAQSLLAKITELDPGGQVILHEIGGRPTGEDLAAVRRSEQAGAPVEWRTEVVAGSLLGDAGMECHPHPEIVWKIPRFGGKTVLGFDGGGHGLARCAESCGEGIASGGKDVSGVGVDGGAQQLVVPGQCRLHLVTMLFPQLGTTGDIGE